MKYKEFVNWCNKRSCDGCWGMNVAMVCINTMNEINKKPFWKREKIWRIIYEDTFVHEIINPIDERIKKLNKVGN